MMVGAAEEVIVVYKSYLGLRCNGRGPRGVDRAEKV